MIYDPRDGLRNPENRRQRFFNGRTGRGEDAPGKQVRRLAPFARDSTCRDGVHGHRRNPHRRDDDPFMVGHRHPKKAR